MYRSIFDVVLGALKRRELQSDTKTHKVKKPFVIAVSGGVCSGKSTFSDWLKNELQTDLPGKKIFAVSTDSFLYTYDFMLANGLLKRKGFPESYDKVLFGHFIKHCALEGQDMELPTYSHCLYDLDPDGSQHICSPDVLIIEGVVAMQNAMYESVPIENIVDFGVYLDAPDEFIFEWYLNRFQSLHDEAECSGKRQKLTGVEHDSLRSRALQIWEEINIVNLECYIRPSAQNADLVVEQHRDHSIAAFRLRHNFIYA
ncbi:hypothetical protein [Pseudomonas putida]|uniref:hypothetical protein n=1 Tax=Pseudomonas putida TaxID=303 RepID=UPI003905829A